MASYRILVRDPFGAKLGDITDFSSLEYACAENQVGTLEMVLPRMPFEKHFAKDLIFEVWRTTGNTTYLDADAVWFLRKWRLVNVGKAQHWELTAYDANYLLTGREVEYDAASGEAQKTDQADDMMKGIILENLSVYATGTGRDLDAYLNIGPALSAAPSTTKGFSRREVLAIFQELAEESYQRGTYLVFNIHHGTGTKLLAFDTYTGCLGINHGDTSGDRVVVSVDTSSLVDPVLEYDYSEEITVATVGGQGTEDTRAIYTITDTERVVETPFSRREVFQDAMQAGVDAAALESEARALLMSGRPKITLTGKVQDTDALQYGIDYRYGDIVVAKHEGYSFDAHIDRIHVTVKREGETLDNRVRGVL